MEDRTFRVTILLGNDAMDAPEDVADALRQIADNLTRFPDGLRPVKDTNGNLVGFYWWA